MGSSPTEQVLRDGRGAALHSVLRGHLCEAVTLSGRKVCTLERCRFLGFSTGKKTVCLASVQKGDPSRIRRSDPVQRERRSLR